MTHETAVGIWSEIERTAWCELKADVVLAAVRYARIRTDWWLADHEGRAEMETKRTAAHDRLIDSLNILARNMTRQGESAAWRASLGQDRRAVGDWACHIHAHLGLLAR